MKYIIGYFWDHGDVFKIIPCDTPEDVREYLKKMDLGPEDYCILKGELLKSFEHKTFDLTRLK